MSIQPIFELNTQDGQFSIFDNHDPSVGAFEELDQLPDRNLHKGVFAEQIPDHQIMPNGFPIPEVYEQLAKKHKDVADGAYGVYVDDGPKGKVLLGKLFKMDAPGFP